MGRPVSRESLIVIAALAAAALLAWVWLLNSPTTGHVSMSGMEGIGPPPLSAAYLLPAFVMWSIMMIAMMVPSAAPVVLLHARIDRAPSATARLFHTLIFSIAYLLVWSAFAAIAATAQAVMVASHVLSAAALSVGTRPLAAGLLLVAAVYETTAVKRLCLDTCQSPLLFVLKYRRPGAAGAFRLGIVHGLYCVGCCWALMLLLFVGGAMNLAWVAVLGIIVVGEKLAPPHWHANRFIAAALFIAAVATLVV